VEKTEQISSKALAKSIPLSCHKYFVFTLSFFNFLLTISPPYNKQCFYGTTYLISSPQLIYYAAAWLLP
jgi:hypothetical protein